MYVKEDIIGASSRIIYARKGDFVTIIRKDIDVTLVEFNNQRFFIRNEKLSEEKIDSSPEVIGENSKSVQRIRKRKR